jgi:hypothetical protein
MSSETLLLLMILVNLKEFKGNVQLYVTPDSLTPCVRTDIVFKLNFLSLQVRRHLDAFLFTDAFKELFIS